MSTNNQLIYLDNNSTTPIDNRVLESMIPFFTTEFANANSTHNFGLKSYEAVKSARQKISNLICADPTEIVFTSGATEAINLAIKGVASNSRNKGNHIVTIQTEHLAVLDACKYIESKDFEVTYMPVQRNGLIDLEKLNSVVRDDTILVIAMFVNNETGVIFPIKEISEIAHKKGALFMSDCTQAVGKISINVDFLGIDLLCFSGHKINAPKGVGALYVIQRFNKIKLEPLFHGGGHERGNRSGTLNVPGIVALGCACEIAKNEMAYNSSHIGILRDRLEFELLKIDGSSINGDTENRLYNTTNILFDGIDSDALILGLSSPNTGEPEIAVSNGSACTSRNIDPSHVLLAMGLNEIEAFSSIRFSLGKHNTVDEIDITVALVKKVVQELRSLSINC